MILETKQVEKPWGVDTLPAPFEAGRPDARIGEIWFEPPAAMPDLLVKYIFTSEKLSVQVHPSDTQTQAMDLGKQGKEECWFIVAAEPGATLGIGMDAAMDEAALRAAAQDGSIEDRIVWHEVQAGDFVYIPANTIHAIGAGVSLIEVQQNSDITYRLYDYGRPRELHLDDGLRVAIGGPHDPDLRRQVDFAGEESLVSGPYFRLDRLDGPPGEAVRALYDGPLLVVPQGGEVQVAGEAVAPGQCALATDIAQLQVGADAKVLITQSIPGAR